MVAVRSDHITRQSRRTHEGLRACLVAYHHGGRVAPPEDSLGVKPTAIEEATFERPADLRMDAETALRKCSSIPFDHSHIAFQYLTAGGTSMAAKVVAQRWSITAREVKWITDRTLDRMVEYLTGRR